MTKKNRKTGDKLARVYLEDSNGEAENHDEDDDALDRMERSYKREEEATTTLPGAVPVPGIVPSDSLEENDADAFGEEQDDGTQQPVVVTAHLVDQNDNPEALRETLQQVQARNQQLEQELNRQKHDKTSQESTVLAVSPVPAVIEPKDVCVDGELDGSRYDDHDESEKTQSSLRSKKWIWLVLILAIAIGAAIVVPILVLRENDSEEEDQEDDLTDGDNAPTSIPSRLEQPSAAPPVVSSATPTIVSSSVPSIGAVGSFEPLLRINCGDDRFSDMLTPIGQSLAGDWMNDLFFSGRGSEVVRNEYNFSSTDLGFLYTTARQQISDRASIFYALPVNTTGLVAIQVHFVEADSTATVGQHVFDVFLQEQPVLTNFDILESATDYYQPVVETLFASVRKGEVWLELNATQGLAKLSGIGVYSFG